MSTGPGRNRRRRGRRGQRGRPQDASQQQAQPQATEAPPAAPPADRQAEAERRPAAEAGPTGENRRRDDSPQGDQRGGRRRPRGKRGRVSKRPALGAMPSEVLKPRVRNVPVTGEMMTQSLDDVTTPSGMTFGCPMLSRTRMGMPFAGGVRVPRCSMGWALHNEEEASFCMRTPDLLDCWKEHPEREAELRGTSDDENENAAD